MEATLLEAASNPAWRLTGSPVRVNVRQAMVSQHSTAAEHWAPQERSQGRAVQSQSLLGLSSSFMILHSEIRSLPVRTIILDVVALA